MISIKLFALLESVTAITHAGRPTINTKQFSILQHCLWTTRPVKLLDQVARPLRDKCPLQPRVNYRCTSCWTHPHLKLCLELLLSFFYILDISPNCRSCFAKIDFPWFFTNWNSVYHCGKLAAFSSMAAVGRAPLWSLWEERRRKGGISLFAQKVHFCIQRVAPSLGAILGTIWKRTRKT